jgi:NADPH2:quinone reductase
MKAAIVKAFGPIEDVALEERPDPMPGAGEVVVEVAAAEMNFLDLLVIEGKYQIKPPLPFSPGKGAAGRVMRVGPAVDGFALDDRVACQVEYGAYAEQVLARAQNCFPIPDRIAFATAAALGLAYQTAYFALKDRARFAAGETVLVLGATGTVGMASIELAESFGAATVIAAVRSAAGAERVRTAGADHVIDLSAPDIRDRLKDEAARLTHGRGVDVIIDPVGGEAHAAALRALAGCGRLVVIGFASGEIPAIRANYLLVKNIAVMGLQWSDYRERAPDEVAAAQREIFSLHLEGKLAPVIARRFPLADVRSALVALRDGKMRAAASSSKLRRVDSARPHAQGLARHCEERSDEDPAAVRRLDCFVFGSH